MTKPKTLCYTINIGIKKPIFLNFYFIIMLEEIITNDLIDSLEVEIDYQELAKLEQEENLKN